MNEELVTKGTEPAEEWRLVGLDAFDGGSYPLSTHPSEEDARRAARTRLEVLEVTQPSASSGGQDGIQDQVYIVRPDGTRYRVTE